MEGTHVSHGAQNGDHQLITGIIGLADLLTQLILRQDHILTRVAVLVHQRQVVTVQDGQQLQLCAAVVPLDVSWGGAI